MTIDKLAAADCRNMTEVRNGVDRIDRQIVALLGERFRYMDAAARIKQERHLVRDEVRKADVIAKVRGHAEAADIPADVVARLYDQLIEASIAYEYERFDAR